MALVSLLDFKSYANITKSDKDDLLEQILDGVSDAAQDEAGRLFSPDPTYDTAEAVTRIVLAEGRRLLRVPDARTVTLVETGDRQDDLTALEDTDWELVQLRADEPATNLRLEARPYRWVKVTGRFGFASVPEDVKLAVLVWAARVAAERDARQGEQQQDADGASVTYFRQSMPLVARTVLHGYRVPVV